MNSVKQKPAEAAGVTSALALLIAHLAGLDDPDVIIAVAVVVGFLPAAVTWTVNLIRCRNGKNEP